MNDTIANFSALLDREEPDIFIVCENRMYFDAKATESEGGTKNVYDFFFKEYFRYAYNLESGASLPRIYSKYKLTDMEYIDVSNMYDFHRSHLRKEKERLLKDLFSAYVNKHNIFDKDPTESTTSDEEVDWDKIRRVMSLIEGMEDVSFHKAITG